MYLGIRDSGEVNRDGIRSAAAGRGDRADTSADARATEGNGRAKGDDNFVVAGGSAPARFNSSRPTQWQGDIEAAGSSVHLARNRADRRRPDEVHFVRSDVWRGGAA